MKISSKSTYCQEKAGTGRVGLRRASLPVTVALGMGSARKQRCWSRVSTSHSQRPAAYQGRR